MKLTLGTCRGGTLVVLPSLAGGGGGGDPGGAALTGRREGGTLVVLPSLAGGGGEGGTLVVLPSLVHMHHNIPHHHIQSKPLSGIYRQICNRGWVSVYI